MVADKCQYDTYLRLVNLKGSIYSFELTFVMFEDEMFEDELVTYLAFLIS